MYHQVHPTRRDGLTVSTAQLEQQLCWLKQNGFQPISCSQLVSHLAGDFPMPAKAVLLTFDDAYRNNFEHAAPVLRAHGFRATIFVPVKYIGGVNQWDGGSEPLLSRDELAQLPNDVFELGLHSYDHCNYKHMTVCEIEADVRLCLAEADRQALRYTPVLAYPYGGFKRRRVENRAMKHMLERHGLRAALRIGSRVNRLPLGDRYELNRIDIRGTDTPWSFRTKVRKGRVKMF